MTKFTIGCDPEIFLTRDGQAVSAHGTIPGDKKSPYAVPGGAIQVDGTAVEFNTEPVDYQDFDSWNAKIVMVMKNLAKEVKAKDPSLTFNLSPVQEYPEEYLAELPEEAKELGCDPDYCAYTLEENPRPDGERPFRTGAGHIHIGWGADIPVDNSEHHEICASFVKMLDATVGLFMTAIDRDPRRRELYGKAGAYRAKPYGVEYRTPSNVWLKSKARRKCVHHLVRYAIQYMTTGYDVMRVHGHSEEEIRKIIDTGNHVVAKSLIKRLWNTPAIYFNSKEFTEEFPNG